MVLLTTSCFARYLNLNVDLYWAEDCAAESVHSLNLNTMQETVIYEASGNPFYGSVTAYEDTAYWTALGRVNSAPVSGGGALTELLFITSYGGTSFRGIMVVHPDLQVDPTDTSIISPVTSSPAMSPPASTPGPTLSPPRNSNAQSTNFLVSYITTWHGLAWVIVCVFVGCH